MTENSLFPPHSSVSLIVAFCRQDACLEESLNLSMKGSSCFGPFSNLPDSFGGHVKFIGKQR